MPEKIIIVTGERYGGKTAKLKSLIAEYRARGLRPAGIISVNPAGESGPCRENRLPDKSRYLAFDIRTGESRLLASEESAEGPDCMKFKRFYFSNETFAWASRVIEKGFSAPVLVIDETGDLELVEKGFWGIIEKTLKVYPGTLVLSIRKQYLSEFLEKTRLKRGFIEVVEAVC